MRLKEQMFESINTVLNGAIRSINGVDVLLLVYTVR